MDDIQNKILTDEDFIDNIKYKNSIKYLIEKKPNGVGNDVIAKSLNISREEVEKTYESAIKKLRKLLKVEP
jgi:hypothetical protein